MTELYPPPDPDYSAEKKYSELLDNNPELEQRLSDIESNVKLILETQHKIFAQTTWCATQLQAAMEAFKSMPGLGNMLGRHM